MCCTRIGGYFGLSQLDLFALSFLFNFLPKLGRQHIGDYGKKTLESYQFSCLQSTQLNTPKNHFLSPFLSSIFHPLKSTRPKWRKHSTYRVKLRLSPSINDLNKSTYCQRVPFFLVVVVVLRNCHYLKGTLSLGLHFFSISSLHVTSFHKCDVGRRSY